MKTLFDNDTLTISFEAKKEAVKIVCPYCSAVNIRVKKLDIYCYNCTYCFSYTKKFGYSNHISVNR